MPVNILNLPAYTVASLFENAHDYHIKASTAQSPDSCIHCNHAKLDGFGRREQMIKDLPMHGKRVGLYVETRRFRCKSCGVTFYEPLPDVDDKRLMTDRLVRWIGEQAVKRTFTSIAEEVGVTEGTVRKIFKDYVADLAAKVKFETPNWMGIDEIFLIKPRGVIANVADNTIVELLPNRSKETIIHYLRHLAGKENIQYVAMDMWVPYREAVLEELPQATIVIDKFHVVRMANEALEKVRKSFRRQLAANERRGLMHDRYVLLKREHDLGDEEKALLAKWIEKHPALGAAHRLKEDFYGVYEKSSSVPQAVERFEQWKRSIPLEMEDAFHDLVRAWTNWHPWILNYFIHPVTNAYTESLNNLIRVMNRLGRGYSFEALRAKILYSHGAHAYRIARPKFQRRRDSEENTEILFSMASPRNAPEYSSSTEMEPVRSPASHLFEDAEPGAKNLGASMDLLIEMIQAGEI